MEYGTGAKRGAITLEDFPLDAEFTTWLGDEINCRTQLCVIRVDTIAGLSRWRWVDIEFTD